MNVSPGTNVVAGGLSADVFTVVRFACAATVIKAGELGGYTAWGEARKRRDQSAG